MFCKKCNAVGAVVLRQKDSYCSNCFIVNINHKFRACIGKNRIFSSQINVLICLSGGTGSTVLMDLVYNSLSLENHKKLRINPIFLHLMDDGYNEDSYNTVDTIMMQCRKHNFNLYIGHLSDYMQENKRILTANHIMKLEDKVNIAFQKMLSTMSPTAKSDFILKVKRNLFISYAKQMECKIVFTAETTTTLAINLLSNLTVGRGGQVESDIGFSDKRSNDVRILRPMKDITAEELHYYLNIKKISPACVHKTVLNCSLQSVIKDFVSNLQENFQATISTVCKTADKLGGNNDSLEHSTKCLICENDLITNESGMTAFEATNISRATSFGKSHFNSLCENISSENNIEKQTMFPFMNKYFCYGCSKNYSEMNKSIPEHIQKKLT